MAPEKSPTDAAPYQDHRNYRDSDELLCTPDGTSQYQLLLQKFSGSLDDAITAAKSTFENARVNTEKSNAALAAERKSNDLQRKAFREYDFLNNCIANYAEQDIVLLQETAAAGKKKFETLSSSVAAIVTNINAAKQKQSALFSLASKLREAVNDSSNSEECKQIEDCLSKTMTVQQKGLSAMVQEIVQRADMLNNRTDDLSEAVVKVTAINGFVNAGSLVAFADSSKTGGTALIKDVAENLKKLLADYENSRKQLGTSAIAMSSAMTVRYNAGSVQVGLGDIRTFVTTPNACRDIIDDLNDLAEQAEQSFSDSDEKQENPEEDEA